MDIRWKASFTASCLHAAMCAEAGWPAVDGELENLVREPAGQLIATLRDNQLNVPETLAELAAWAGDYANNRQLVEVALAKLHGPGFKTERLVSELSAAIGVLVTKLLAARPELVGELALRGQPLQQQWNARGPGLLQQVRRFTDETFLVPLAEVVLVTPWVGGYGASHLKSNRVVFEAVLANPHAELPEALRLGWLLAQLNGDVPIYSESIPADRLALIAGLATLPPLLAAAETVEWADCNVATIEQALQCWHVSADPSAALAEQLWQWWQTYLHGSMAWNVAWRALETLLR